MADWIKKLASDLDVVRKQHLTEAQEFAAQMGYDRLAVLVGSTIGGFDPQRMIGMAHYALERCRSQGEQVLVACLFAIWPRHCALQLLWRDTGRYTDPLLTGFVDEAGDGADIQYMRLRHCARVHIYQRSEGPYALGLAVDFSTRAEVGEPGDDWRLEEVTLKCNIEVSDATDFERDVYLQNAGYLVRRVSDSELTVSPVQVVTEILGVLTEEANRRAASREQLSKQTLRLVSS